jgi:Alternative complex III, ActD subunit
MNRVDKQDLIGVFSGGGEALAAAKNARKAGITIREVYSPIPDHALIETISPRTSPIRYITFAGAAAGLIGGMALALMTSKVWNLIVGGKPVTSIIPFIIVGFELTILFGVLATLIGLLIFSRLPNTRFPSPGYDGCFSADRFGIHLQCNADQISHAETILTEAGAVDVRMLPTKQEKHAL